jgi:hypothetical protein
MIEVGEFTNQSIIVQLLALFCHSWLDQESSLFSWIPAGVYPVLDTGRE